MPTYNKAEWQAQQETKRKELSERLRQGVRDIISSDTYRSYLLTMGKFQKYSWHNAILIYLQKPNATKVAGFVDWKNKFERFVKKGEHGISILAPRFPGKQRTLDERIKALGREPTPEELQDLKHQIDDEMQGIAPRSFLIVTVFDVSQTEGKPLPEMGVPVLSASPPLGLLESLHRYRIALGLTLVELPETTSAMGNFTGSTIGLKAHIPLGQQVKTLAHELAHAVTHKSFGMSYATGEVLAESISYVVCGHFGFDTGVRSFVYVALWAKDEKVLYSNMATISKVAGAIIDALEGRAT